MDRPTGATESRSARSATDASALLVELGRVLKAWRFYPPDHPARADLLDRTRRAWQGELRRGPLDLEIRRGSFWLAGTETAVGRGHLDDLARQFKVRAVRRLRVHPDFGTDGLCAFLEMLATDPEALAAGGGAEAHLDRARAVGFQVNDADYAALLEGGGEAHGGPGDDGAEDAAADGVDLAAPLEPLEAPVAAPDPGPTAAEGAAPPPIGPEQALIQLLEELDGCDDDGRYRELADEVAQRGASLADEGRVDAGLTALHVLSDHAGDDAKRSSAQREVALEGIERLFEGALLDAVLRQVAGTAADLGLRATELLLLVGERAAPALLERIEREEDADRRQRLTAAFLAMGHEALTGFEERIERSEPGRRGRLLRLAGETQNPRLVPALRQVLLHGEDGELRDAARSLVRIGDVGAVDALVEGLASPSAAVVEVCAYGLGAVGRALAVGPLTHALERALEADRLELAREIVRALGRLGRAEAVPALKAVLVRKRWFAGARLRELKSAALTSLGRLPGHEAFQTLQRAAGGRDSTLREAAAAALERRGGGSESP